MVGKRETGPIDLAADWRTAKGRSRHRRAVLKLDPGTVRRFVEQAERWPGRRLLGPGRSGGRPPLLNSFLEALLDTYSGNEKLHHHSKFSDRLIPVTARYWKLTTRGSPVLYPWKARALNDPRPDMRHQFREAFPSSGDLRLQEYARRACQEHLIQAYRVDDGIAEDFMALTRGKPPSVAVVPDLLYNSCLPTSALQELA